MALKKIPNFGKNIKKWYFNLRNDVEALSQFRLLVLGLLMCFVIYYGGITLFVKPKSAILEEKLIQKQRISESTPIQLTPQLTAALEQLRNTKTNLQEQIEILQMKIQYLKDHWSMLGDADRFTKIIFTLMPTAPVNIEKELVQMSRTETRSMMNYEVHPVTLAGNGRFHNFLSYLQYIETRPEVGVIDNLVVKSMPAEEKEYGQSDVFFSFMVGRINLKQSL